MFKEIKSELAQKYKQLELDQLEIMQKLQAYKDSAQQKWNTENNSLLIDDIQDSSVLILSTTQREISEKTFNEMRKALDECERERDKKIEIINDLKKQNQKLQDELAVTKNNHLKSVNLLQQITQQKEELMNQMNLMKKQKSIDSTFYQTSITDITNQDISMQENRRKSLSNYESSEQKLYKQYKKFADCIQDMIIKLQPKLYQNKSVTLAESWKWLKAIINDYVQLANIVKQLKTMLNVEQPYIVLEVQQLINVIINKQQ